MNNNLFKEKQYKIMLQRGKPLTYGRCINLSYGLIFGLLIDKLLFYITKGLSIFIPPFSVMLMSKGKIIKHIRFEKNLGKFEFLVKHFVKE